MGERHGPQTRVEPKTSKLAEARLTRAPGIARGRTRQQHITRESTIRVNVVTAVLDYK